MFSRPNHHHQNGTAACPTAPLQPTQLFSSLEARDNLLTHHRHLETLLDSALATLTLIHESESTAGSPLPYSPHLLGVFHLLSCRISPQTIATTDTPVSLPDPATTRPDLPIAPATYAAVTQSPTTSETHTAKHPIADSPPVRDAAQPSAQRPTRVIIRFDKEPAHLPRVKARLSPAALYAAITTALRPLFENMTHVKLFLAGVGWTKSGNIALHPAAEGCTAKLLAAHSDTIWEAIRPLLRLADDRECPVFDTDDKWHSVVFHGVPMPARRTEALEFFAQAREMINGWVTSPSSQGELREYSVLCRPSDLEKKATLALRLSFSSEADAERLVKNGGHLFGVACRVSRYVPRPRSRTHTPEP
ncbi:hypothetical protein B0H11DRAFT_2371985 [Mycena galericulata]|nr:hypothetical protein B0H11DRAFT_2371985 [Mycena galericulata]